MIITRIYDLLTSFLSTTEDFGQHLMDVEGTYTILRSTLIKFLLFRYFYLAQNRFYCYDNTNIKN